MRNIFKALSVCTIVSGTALSGLFGIQPLNNTGVLEGKIQNNMKNANNEIDDELDYDYFDMPSLSNNSPKPISCYIGDAIGHILSDSDDNDDSGEIILLGRERRTLDDTTSDEDDTTFDEDKYIKSKIPQMSVDEYTKKLDEILKPVLEVVKLEKQEDLKQSILAVAEDMLYQKYEIFDMTQRKCVPMDESIRDLLALIKKEKLGGDAAAGICNMELNLIKELADLTKKELENEIAKKMEEKRKESDRRYAKMQANRKISKIKDLQIEAEKCLNKHLRNDTDGGQTSGTPGQQQQGTQEINSSSDYYFLKK